MVNTMRIISIKCVEQSNDSCSVIWQFEVGDGSMREVCMADIRGAYFGILFFPMVPGLSFASSASFSTSTWIFLFESEVRKKIDDFGNHFSLY